MAENPGASELEAREAEAEEARARLSKTLETLTSPETQEGVKAEVLNHVQAYKDELLKHADRYKDELLQKADEYKNEALQRADAYKDEALQRVRDVGREAVQNVVADLKTRAANNPVAVALIGAGVGWRLYKHPPITTLLVGAGAALLMRTPGRSGQDDATSDRDPFREMPPRPYVPRAEDSHSYPVDEESSGASTRERITAMASSAGESARHAASETGGQIVDASERAKSMMSRATEGTLAHAGSLASTVRQNPLLLAIVGIAAGAAVARSVRATETGDHLVHGLGRGAREMTTRVSDAASQAVEGLGSVASAARSTVSEVADSVRARVPEVTSGLTDAAGRAVGVVGNLTSSTPSEGDAPDSRQTPSRNGKGRGLDRRELYQAGMSQRAGREIVEMAERYPVLLSTAGLLLGAIAGAALRPTDAEDLYVGPAGDALKRRAKQTVSEQFEWAIATADQVIASVESHVSEHRGAEPSRGEEIQPVSPSVASKAADDIEREDFVAEPAENVVQTTPPRKRKKAGRKSRAAP